MPKQNAKKRQRDKGVKDFENLPPLNQNAAGIDVGKALVQAQAVPEIG